MSSAGRERDRLKKETELLKAERAKTEARTKREQGRSKKIMIRGIRSRRGGSGYESATSMGSADVPVSPAPQAKESPVQRRDRRYGHID